MIHNNNVEAPRYRTDYEDRNRDLRVKYLENALSEEDFKTYIQRNDKKNRKDTEILQVIQLLNTAFIDIIYRLLDYLGDNNTRMPNIETYITESNEIRNYCNDIFKDISFSYNSPQYAFNDVLAIIKVDKEKVPRKKSAIEECDLDG